MKKAILTTVFIGLIGFSSNAQKIISDVIISTDSADYALSELPIQIRRNNYLYFVLDKLGQEVQLTIKTRPETEVNKISFVKSPGYIQLDSIIKTDTNTFVVDIRFTNIFDIGFPKLFFEISTPHGKSVEETKLYAFIFPTLEDLSPQIEIFNSQEVTIPLPIKNPALIKYNSAWKTEGIVDYKLVKTSNGPSLKIKPNAVGLQSLTVGVQSIKPFLNTHGNASSELFDFKITVRVVRSKFNYLNFTEPSYFFEPRGEKAITTWFDYNPNIKLNKTYRIEDQEGPGGRLVAEIYTRAYVENQNKVIASMRTYSLHQIEGGLLYVKEGDRNRFFTNFNIAPKPYIEKVEILRPGKEWTESHIVYPGEEIELKIQGTGLANSEINFSDGKHIAIADTVRKNNNVRYFTLTVPSMIKERSIPISLNHNTTSFELLVNEYQRPRKLDFITINYGDGDHEITGEKFYKPALYDEEIGDLVIAAHINEIDGDNNFYGVQYVDVEIRLWDKNNRQIESRKVEGLKLVPDITSIRSLGYDHNNESNAILRINDVLVNKTHDLRPWSKIEITVEHDKDKYEGNGHKSKAIIYRSHNMAVDIEVSFPAGLFVVQVGEPEVNSLTGLSIASMANFTFYKKGQIKKEQPLRLGIGFIALNAINSITGNVGAESDIGAVSLLSFQPLHSESKINFPLYAGFGYLFNSQNLFFLIGPGIKITF